MIAWKRWRSEYGYWLVYVVLSVLMTWPLVVHLNTHLAGCDADLFNVYWGNWWTRRALSTGQNPYWTPDLLYPIGFDLTSFAFSPFLALIWMPLSGLLPSIAAYNLVVLATIVLCCIAMEGLVSYLTGDRWAARVAAFAFAFAPCIAAQRASHLNLAMLAWIPWSALLLTRLVRGARARDALLLAMTVVLAFLTRLHVGVLALLFCGVYLGALALIQGRQWHKRAGQGLALAGLLSLVLLSPLAFQLSRLLSQPGGEDVLRQGAETHQADLLAYLLPVPQHPLFGRWTEPIYAGRFEANYDYWAYLGWVPLVLAVYAGVKRPRQAGPWLLTGLFFFILALGPSLRAGGRWYPGLKLPYAWAERLFSLAGFNVPNRFNLALAPALGVLVGLACAEIGAGHARRRRWLVGLAAVLILFEYLVVPIPLYCAPPDSPFYRQAASDGQDYAIVDLPLTREAGELHRYYQTLHQKPIVGGWDHRVPPTTFAFIDSVPLLYAWTRSGAQDASLIAGLADLARANVRYLVLHRDQLKCLPGGLNALFVAFKPVYWDESIYVWSTDWATSGTANVAHVFDDRVRLLQPAVSLSATRPEPALALDLCWMLGDVGRGVDAIGVTLSGADGALLGERRAQLAARAAGGFCQTWSWPLDPSRLSGPLVFQITPYTAGRPLGTYVYAPPEVHAFQDARGRERLLLGEPLPVGFDAPLDVPGYRLQVGEGLAWVDVYWHSLADHHQAYRMFVQLIDLSTGELVANSDVLLPRLDWERGEVLQSHRVLLLDQVPPGTYRLGFGLVRKGDPAHRVPAFVEGAPDRAPGDLVTLAGNVVILPPALQDAPGTTGQRVVPLPKDGQALRVLDRQARVRFGEQIELVGYAISTEQMAVAQDARVTLYWSAGLDRAIEKDYQVFVHLVDESGRIVAQHDGEPVGGHQPTGTWRDELVVDVHRLVWQVDEYSGQATIFAGLYDPRTQERLAAHRPADGARVPHDAVPLGQVTVLTAR